MKENTHEEVLKDFNTLVGGEELKEIIEYPANGNWHKLYSNVIAHFERAKKEHELLELYRDKEKARDELGYALQNNPNEIGYWEIKINVIVKKILELESEI